MKEEKDRNHINETHKYTADWLTFEIKIIKSLMTETESTMAHEWKRCQAQSRKKVQVESWSWP